MPEQCTNLIGQRFGRWIVLSSVEAGREKHRVGCVGAIVAIAELLEETLLLLEALFHAVV